jgi:maltooligosyltrehalose trehalohydrolase
LLINLQGDFPLSPIPEPLLAPHPETRWQLLWCSEHPRYGGRGMVQPQTDENWICRALPLWYCSHTLL